MTSYPLPIFLERFFTDRLVNQMEVTTNTLDSYRHSFVLLLKFARDSLGREPTDMLVTDIDVALVGSFLNHIETERGNTARSRNTRLTAIRSFFSYVAINEPGLLHHCHQVLALPAKRYEKPVLAYLEHEEINALLAAPDLTTWYGRRDRTILQVFVQTGLRISELIGLDCSDVDLGTGAHVSCSGKGRKRRRTPLRRDTVISLREWLGEHGGADDQPLFISNRSGRLSRDAVERIVRKHVTLASKSCPSLRTKKISAHSLRHTAAMTLLHRGVGRTMIALYLGHECASSTSAYLHADMKLKEKILERTRPIDAPRGRYRPGDALLEFLEGL